MSTTATNEQTVQIGDAAALYGLAPSTLRWWERQGVLNLPARQGNRRSYTESDLRRIGVAYLCCVTGKMPLEAAAVVAAGESDVATWQQTVREQIARLESEMAQLRIAADYLGHLLDCVDDDMVRCPYLDAELAEHTPRGRVANADFVAAARAARPAD
ncbi:DNA-binding transcriptional MerR regulator [Tamaricihabitans halophyticus]|uniref:DNA-binding transcriptional MerR regulator n=1 Tax=Tamaricihabitans halophyticus TaxID=1262583 RepID=A0A4R2QKY5_9PSEU|nr:MerR family transcriptional regulator [Tamaricihabitans halophyticus]TCP49997.1 DNA-binding transcriptional MerR regulator [Tamaricihabitans halophyticus]